jgi:hypothetical protein
MVSKELLDTYERLNTRLELYKKATQRGNSISGLGVIILFLSVIPIIPSVLQEYYGIDFFYSFAGGILFGLILIKVGQKVNERSSPPAKLSTLEEMFLKVVESLKNIEAYQRQPEIKFLRDEAYKKLLKIERRLREPPSDSYPFWQGLARELNENLRLLKQNLKEKIIPRISEGKEDDIKTVFPIIEEFGRYLLNPTIQKLKDVNESMSELKPIQKEKAMFIPLKPFFERHPYLRYCTILLMNGLCGFLAFHIGINYLHVSIDTAYTAAITLFGTLTLGYITVVTKRGK